MVVEFDAGRHQRPAEHGLARHGPDAFFGAFLDEDETVAGDAEETLDLADSAAAAAVIVDVDLPADGAALNRVGDEFRLQPLLLPAAERQDRKFRTAFQRTGRHIIRGQILISIHNNN